MSRRIKLFTSLSTFTMIGALALSGCSEKASSNHDEGERGAVSAISDGGSESEGGGSEGGESGGSQSEGSVESGSESEGGGSSVDLAANDIEYLHRLGQVRGHLAVFIALHNMGAHDMSQTHAKHPESELYADLIPAFQKRSKAGFADELEAVSNAVTNGDDLEVAYQQVSEAITANEPNATIVVHLLALSKVARTAGDEFNIGVTPDGVIVNAHEYQDAYGFLMAAKQTLSRLKAATSPEQAAMMLAHEQINLALKEFGDLTAATTMGKASALYGAAARIELAALGLE